MRFQSKLENYYSLLKEQPESPDAAMPQPEAKPESNVVSPVPVSGKEKPAENQVNIPPEGYVDMVRMLAKALAMNIPTGDLDALFTGGEIKQENAFEMTKGLEAVMKDSEIKSDNMERLRNPNYKKFVSSIDEKNFMQKYKYLLNVMKKKSPYIQ